MKYFKNNKGLYVFPFHKKQEQAFSDFTNYILELANKPVEELNNIEICILKRAHYIVKRINHAKDKN